MRVWTLQRPAPRTRRAAAHGRDARQRDAKRSFAGRIPKQSLGTTETTEDEVFARHRGIIAELGLGFGEFNPPRGAAGMTGRRREEVNLPLSRLALRRCRRG